MRRLELSDDECLLLDGRVNAAAQETVDWVKSIRQYNEAGSDMAAEIIAAAVKQGYLRMYGTRMAGCSLCGATQTYSKPRGRQIFGKPMPIYGMAYNEGGVTVQNYPRYGACSKCAKTLTPQIVNYIRQHRLPVELAVETLFAREERKQCRNCQRLIWEFDMGISPTLMGDGHFYSKCPYCCTEGGWLALHGSTKEFRCVPVEGLKRHRNLWLRAANPMHFGSPYMTDEAAA